MFELTTGAPDASPIYAEDIAFNAENLALNAPVYSTPAADKIKPQIVARAAVESITRVQEYLDGDWLPVPLKPDTDQVNCDRWNELQLTDETVADYFDDNSNIGVELGKRSGGLTCLHLRTEDAAIAGEYLAPPTGSRFSLESERRSSHLLYTTKLAEAENAPRAISYIDPTDGKPLVEIIIGGASEPAYMVFPPSVIDQECVQWDAREHENWVVSEASDEGLKESARLIALVAILSKHWHKVEEAKGIPATNKLSGASRCATLVARALGGFLHHAGIARSDALRILSCLAAATASGAPGGSRNFQDCVGYHDNYHIPGWDSEANVKKLSYAPALGPYVLLGGVFGNPIIHAISVWFDYDPNKSHAITPPPRPRPQNRPWLSCRSMIGPAATYRSLTSCLVIG